jgi:hypothetical protein
MSLIRRIRYSPFLRGLKKTLRPKIDDLPVNLEGAGLREKDFKRYHSGAKTGATIAQGVDAQAEASTLFGKAVGFFTRSKKAAQIADGLDKIV